MQSLKPSPLMVSEPGSFAEQTIVKRKPQIIKRIIATRVFDRGVIAKLQALEAEIASGPVAPLTEIFIDTELWNSAWKPFEGQTWRELPWFFAETFFYRRVLEATGYYQPGDFHSVDPFMPDKREAMAHGLADMTSIVKFVSPDLSPEERLTLWLHRSLWGNRADLSNREVLEQARHHDADHSSLLVIDHTAAVLERFYAGKARRVEFACDNAGLELLSDMFLADELLQQKLVDQIVFNLKPGPFFVSDATMQDFAGTLGAMQGAQAETIREVHARLDDAALHGRVRLSTHPFWITPFFFSEMPADLQRQFGQADLLILKGDVNYRRLLEDRHWPENAELEAIARHMPTSFLALRTLKSEIIVGLEEGTSAALSKIDKHWLTNGDRGLLHLVAKEAHL
ncbi:MAG: protein-glutamate O-methyltransferase family protein [Chloroflexi bacterium]|nr:protein-glutamate O-methyltransferase family protein [Chloroflexota bacterium]